MFILRAAEERGVGVVVENIVLVSSVGVYLYPPGLFGCLENVNVSGG
jgi:hypothetical protein